MVDNKRFIRQIKKKQYKLYVQTVEMKKLFHFNITKINQTIKNEFKFTINKIMKVNNNTS